MSTRAVADDFAPRTDASSERAGRHRVHESRGEVPVLVHDEHVLTETTLILEYLDSAFPEIPLTPTDPTARYRMRVWTKQANDYFAPALMLLGWHLRMAQPASGCALVTPDERASCCAGRAGHGAQRAS